MTKNKKRSSKPILIGQCVGCGAAVHDGVPQVCCVQGVLAHLGAVLENAAATVRAR